MIGERFYNHSKEMNRAQACADKTAARLTGGSDDARSIARAASVFCKGEIDRTVADIGDILQAKKVKDALREEIINRAEYVVVAVRAAGCMDNPNFRRLVGFQ